MASDYIDGGPGDGPGDGGVRGDYLLGNNGNDTIHGRGGRDVMLGGNGNDVLNGGAHGDYMVGGAGSDRFVFSSLTDLIDPEIGDHIADFVQGEDRIDLSALGPALSIAVSNDGSRTYLDLDADGDGLFEATVTLAGVHNLTSNDFI
ncbi:MAG: M10 family metallopeptidase C-terminal domain-containing protein, partial [Rhodospirillales bacterium]|nr:M10 family metallopeptidase C-terminal domain-containing protein [Rhodospirillales bacterium]